MGRAGHTHLQIAKQVELLRGELDHLREMVGKFDPTIPPEEISAEWIHGILEARRRRDKVFGGRIFNDPAWDIVLAVYALQLGNERATITDVCRVTGVPNTTVIRWVRQLEQFGLLNQKNDKVDARLVLLELSERGRAAMREYFEPGQGSGVGL